MRSAPGLLGGVEPVLRVPVRADKAQERGEIGNLFGGWLMAQIDIAGGIVAVLRSRGPAVTAAVEQLAFLVPVRVWDVLSVYADLLDIGRTSMRIRVEAYVHRNPQAPEFIRVAEATLTYVAVDAAGEPRPVRDENAARHSAPAAAMLD
ncbi:acyl-CoA thioesterase [Acidihalobacter ferrooxydans]|uniref:HotDog ACOT-type domain-containing protein n=1 Tax=Acidihalobacter ferrooxydans TaxID=1765967 RepID=A0A1P8UEA3_9GAMM|nr:hotdog domain-containing protein [Acidihalobacter ferrooxydans]APZ42192.1 hypothetical protein BW247_03030 [Acidihalobacter ferrooxydans]